MKKFSPFSTFPAALSISLIAMALLGALMLGTLANAEELTKNDASPVDDKSSESGEKRLDPSEIAQALDRQSCQCLAQPFSANTELFAQLEFEQGSLCCKLYPESFPLTVLNFIALADEKQPWTDAQGQAHDGPYYRDLALSEQRSGAFFVVAERPEGSDFLIPDERCQHYKAKPGALAMVQRHPGQASTQFMVLAREQPSFDGMYAFFGQCGPLSQIQSLTRTANRLQSIEIRRENCSSKP